ncbi:MAG: hypothetical protein ABEI98_04750 [Halorhabdus sp.]
MTNQDNTPEESGYRRDIREAWKDALAKLAQLEEEPSPSGEMKRQVAVALNTFRKTLRPHRDEDALETPWDERGVDIVEHWVHGEVEVEQQLNRRGKVTETVTVPKAYELPPHKLDAAFEELQAIAKELGNAAPVPESTHRTEITDDLVEEVESWRQQNLVD